MKEEDFQDFKYGALKLSALMSVVFGIQFFYQVQLGFNASESPFWKFFTSIFAHSGLDHLFNNLFFIALFGSVYELHTSRWELYRTFLVSALFANLAAFLFFPDSFIIGASGGAMGILAALTVLRPNQIGLALGIPAPMWAVLIVYIFINFAGLTGGGNTAYEAHLLGLVSGALIGYIEREKPLLPDEDQDDNKEVKRGNWERRIQRWEEKYMK